MQETQSPIAALAATERYTEIAEKNSKERLAHCGSFFAAVFGGEERDGKKFPCNARFFW
jgi:hypothetical protein